MEYLVTVLVECQLEVALLPFDFLEHGFEDVVGAVEGPEHFGSEHGAVDGLVLSSLLLIHIL